LDEQQPPEDTPTATRLPLECTECRREWLVARERWRLCFTDDDPPEAAPYCPECASREFDP
jgi:hypothetical protein